MGVPIVGSLVRKVFGSHNDRMVKRYLRVVDEVSSHEAKICPLTDAQIRAKTDEFRSRVEDGESTESLLPEVFAVAREAMDRAVGIRNIFNPEAGFDPSALKGSVRAQYDAVKKIIDETPDQAPEGELLGGTAPVPAWQTVDIPNEIYEAVRALYPKSRPPFRARPFDVQIIGGIVLYEGQIAEMKTGEGKTIVAPLATYLAAVEGRQVHVITVNDYLVQRDRDWTFPFFRALGLTAGAIHPYHMQRPEEKFRAYQCDVIYGTTAEFGFDYLRDNMKPSVEEQVQKHRNFAIVDEVDSTLIDEARTPLIISGMAHQHRPRYELADKLARHLISLQADWNRADERVQSCLVKIATLEGDIRNARDKSQVPAMKKSMEAARQQLPELEDERARFTQYYEVEMDKKRATLTHAGIAAAQKESGIGSFYVGENMDIPHLLEQSIRGHTVYQRDRDYVIATDENGQMGVVIVDQNTGRKMPGRQWSDGLHQAVEAKEGVPIKDETQTMATITIQNFFKMYDKLAGMTGTADTEATEFYEIYKLDVVVIPTNVPVVRDDYDDLMFIAEKDKWDAIVDEVKSFHDMGRPVLVGTTSVERSDMLSQMLTRKHSIEHEVLNAKQHEREADIVAHAGELGAVMIATNMAGRGTDIKLNQVPRATLIDHWKRRSICPKAVTPEMADADILAAVHRHMASKELGLKKAELESMSDTDVRLAMLKFWAEHHTFLREKKIEGMSAEALEAELDAAGSCLMHRLRMFSSIDELGGLHVIGTERHESRRIDNQLRGRSGRQGDRGSSRFYVSLEDPLMKMFAGEKTLKVLSSVGMKEGDSIENPMLTKAISRAQRKVEERNFLSRKNLLEWDEVLNAQRHEFYDMRQAVLENRGIKQLIFEHIEESVMDAVDRFLDKMFVAKCISEWVHEHVNVMIEPERFRGKDREDLHNYIASAGAGEAARMIEVTIGEYMPTDIDLGKGTIEHTDRATWNLSGLADWANATFAADVTAADLLDKEPKEVIRMLEVAAAKYVESQDLTPLDRYIVPNYGATELCKWAKNKFGAELEPEQFVGLDKKEEAFSIMMKRAHEVYRLREITYPIEFALDSTSAMIQHDPQVALTQFTKWVNARYELGWSPHALPSSNPAELRAMLMTEAEKWDESRISERADRAIQQSSSPEELNAWFVENMGAKLTDDELARASDDPMSVAEEKIAKILRAELTQFERWVLLQIVDQAWKDHLHAIDQLRESIGFRSFSQRDPRIEFKREGAAAFAEMFETIRDKVTELVFKAKLTPQVRVPEPTDPGAPPQGKATQAAPTPVTAGVPGVPGGATGGSPRAESAPVGQTNRESAPAPRRAPVRVQGAIGRNEVVTIRNPQTGEEETVKYKKAAGRLASGWQLVEE
jgi:preprotein translocase subunit SecA